MLLIIALGMLTNYRLKFPRYITVVYVYDCRMTKMLYSSTILYKENETYPVCINAPFPHKVVRPACVANNVFSNTTLNI